MSRFNTSSHKAKPAVATAVSPLGTVSKQRPDTRTFEGAPGWVKDAKTDLFLRASASLNDGGDKFYESGYERDEKLRQLARQVAVEDFTWFAEFVEWLRRVANIRTNALMIASDGVKARLDAGEIGRGHAGATVPHPDAVNQRIPSNRSVIDSVLYRADEPGEMLAYWTHQYGRAIPKPVKRGVADAVRRLYSEKSLLKYDTGSHSYRFGDVLNLVHAAADPDKPYQGALFGYALDRRHNPDTAEIPESLRMLRRNKTVREIEDPDRWLDPDFLESAGITWETALSTVGSKVDKKKIWEAMIPSMGYMALLRNLRNFDEAGISNQVANQVVVRLAREDEVAKSRQLPFRFLSAYKNAPSMRWGHALETALDLATRHIPELPGRTLILTDTSGSMMSPISTKSTVKCLEAAGLFAASLALRNAGHVDLYQYADYTAPIDVPKGGSVLRMMEAFLKNANRVGMGTRIAAAVRETYQGHDRVVILTDGQGCNYGSTTASGVGDSVPAHVPVYLFNIEGYSASPMPTGAAARFDLGGLSDQTFKLIPLLEQGRGNLWPWEIKD